MSDKTQEAAERVGAFLENYPPKLPLGLAETLDLGSDVIALGREEEGELHPLTTGDVRTLVDAVRLLAQGAAVVQGTRSDRMPISKVPIEEVEREL